MPRTNKSIHDGETNISSCTPSCYPLKSFKSMCLMQYVIKHEMRVVLYVSVSVCCFRDRIALIRFPQVCVWI